MNRLPRIVLPALAILALGAGTASAQSVPSPFRYIETKSSIEITAGYLVTDPEISLNDSVKAEFGPQSAPIVSLGYTRRLGGPLSANVRASFSPGERKVISAAEAQNGDFEDALETGETVSAPLAMLEGGLRFHVTGDRAFRGFAPYLGVSGGLVTELGDADEAETRIPTDEQFEFGPAFAVGASAGVDWFATRRLSLRTELNFRLWRLSAPEGFATGRNAEINEWKGNPAVSLGAAFHF